MDSLNENISTLPKKRISKRPITVDEFEKWQAKRKGDCNYEFYYGQIIKKSGAKQIHALIIANLNRRFAITEAYKNGDGLFGKCDVYIDEFRKRVPDFAYFTDSQIVVAAKSQKVYPTFIIEILPLNISFDESQTKLQDYFDAGVKLVWYVLPSFKKIYIYTTINQALIFISGQTISVNPVISDFEINIDHLFSVD